MVGIFSKFSTSKSGHRRTQSAIDERDILPPNAEVVEGVAGVDAGPYIVGHGVEVAVEFKPVEHPTEPLDDDRPVQCPLPEPSILNDGRIWKERVSAANVRRRADLPRVREGSEGNSTRSRSQFDRSDRMILPSQSAPERNILTLLEECNASGM